ncbi:hypothetical protein [Pandoraea anhela]|uniref:Lipoprotein n=1 Tax=Pandoraea anhela TaxID=2508295 RepID=A0A5E4XPI3_9BURK|nr:hypothetical protein [Pandoraea anhela]VVE38143.1 hypothetical protein PAN31108_03995 [Pandoraea anhela]
MLMFRTVLGVVSACTLVTACGAVSPPEIKVFNDNPDLKVVCKQSGWFTPDVNCDITNTSGARWYSLQGGGVIQKDAGGVVLEKRAFGDTRINSNETIRETMAYLSPDTKVKVVEVYVPRPKLPWER